MHELRQAGETDGTRPQRTAEEAEALVITTIQEHADTLLRIARRHSLCDDDAADAYQRALEIFLRHVRRLDEETAHRWLYKVVRHEAQAVRGQRQRTLGRTALDADLLEARHLDSPEESVVRAETMAHAAEALGALKQAELQALWLQAAGSSYAQIAERSGWTQTKVNRSLVEGRRRFMARRDAIDSGQECERWRPHLAALVAGRAGADELREVRPHLRNCQACQAHMRALHRVGGAQAAALAPVALVALPSVQIAFGRLAGWYTRVHDAVGVGVQERLALPAVKLQVTADALSAGKVAAVAASAAALAGGGVAVMAPETSPAGRPAAVVAAGPERAVATAPASALIPRRSAAASPLRPREARPGWLVQRGAATVRTAPAVRRAEFGASATRGAVGALVARRQSAPGPLRQVPAATGGPVPVREFRTSSGSGSPSAARAEFGP